MLRAISAEAARQFHTASARLQVQALGEGTHHISLDGHSLPRHIRLVDLHKGKMGNLGRILKADELVLAYDLDTHTC